MRLKNPYLALMAPMLMSLMPSSKNSKVCSSTSNYQRTNLPTWKIGEHIIYAKDAKMAEKYAKKRGFWKEGCNIEKEEK